MVVVCVFFFQSMVDDEIDEDEDESKSEEGREGESE